MKVRHSFIVVFVVRHCVGFNGHKGSVERSSLQSIMADNYTMDFNRAKIRCPLDMIKDYRNTKMVRSYIYEWDKLKRTIWRNSPAF